MLKHVKENRLLYLIIILTFILKIIFMSNWLEDWDSVQFALALKDFSLIKHQPHPPGYPVYIFLGRILYLFIQDQRLALILLSIISSSFSVVFLYLLIKDFTSKSIALFSSILYIITPINWILSEVALSNVVGMSFLILSVYLLVKGIKSNKLLFLGSFLSGLTIGVRFAEYSTVLLVLGFVLIQRRKIQHIIKSLLMFTLGVLIWLIPVLIDTGVEEFISLYLAQASYIKSHDSILHEGTSIRHRLYQIKNLLLVAYTKYYLVNIAIIGALIFKTKRLLKNDLFIISLLWLFSYFILLVFLYNLEVPRHTLPLLPPLIILFSISLYEYKKNKALQLLSFIVLLLILPQSYHQIYKQKTLIPPTIQPVIFVKENYKPNDTTLITSFTYKHFEYYTRGFSNFWGTENPPDTVETKYVITDFEKLNYLDSVKNYILVATREFRGPSEIFPRVPITKLYIFEHN